MKLTAKHVFEAHQVLTAIIAAGRPMPVKGAYRLGRLYAKMLPEFKAIEDRRNAIILDLAKGSMAAVPTVPDDKMDEFRAQWGEIASEEIELDVEPVPVSLLEGPGLFTAQELMALGDLVTE